MSTRTGSGTTSASTGLDQGGAEDDLMELNSWTSPQMLRRYGTPPAELATRSRSFDTRSQQQSGVPTGQAPASVF